MSRLLLLLLLAGCGRVGFERDAATDAPRLDGGTFDAGALDSGTTDGGETDAGAEDGGTADAGTADAGTTDAGTTDAGTADAGTTDAGTTDAGTADAGTADAGSIDGAVVPSCARPFETVPATGLVSGEFMTATVNDVGSCGGAPSPDFVYAVTVDVSGTAILVATDLPGTTSDTVAYVRSECAVSATELACDDDSGTSTGAVARTAGLAPGAYFVFVDQVDGRNRRFDATIELLLPVGAACDPTSRTARCAPELACVGGLCAAAGCTPTESFAGPGTYAPTPQTTVGQPSLHVGTCSDGGLRSPERVYEVVLAAPVANLRVTTDHPMTAYDTLVYVRSGCSGAEVACDDDGGFDLSSTLATGPLPAGTYYVFVDGFAGAAGVAEVTIEVVP